MDLDILPHIHLKLPCKPLVLVPHNITQVVSDRSGCNYVRTLGEALCNLKATSTDLTIEQFTECNRSKRRIIVNDADLELIVDHHFYVSGNKIENAAPILVTMLDKCLQGDPSSTWRFAYLHYIDPVALSIAMPICHHKFHRLPQVVQFSHIVPYCLHCRSTPSRRPTLAFCANIA
jgi:hypothetical protein